MDWLAHFMLCMTPRVVSAQKLACMIDTDSVAARDVISSRHTSVPKRERYYELHDVARATLEVHFVTEMV